MTIYTSLILLLTCASLAHFYLVGRREGVLTLDGVFVIAQWVMATGTLLLLDSHNSADRLYAYVVSVPMALYIAASIGTNIIVRKRRGIGPVTPVKRVDDYRPSVPIWLLLALSIVVTVAYYLTVGYNTLFAGIQSVITGTKVDYTTLRLQSYSGTKYLFPGYVNQFKNIILPSLALVAVLYLFRTRARFRYAAAALLVGVTIYGILGTGQRGAFILFCLTLVIFMYLHNRAQFPRRAALTALAAAPLLLAVTYLLGRRSAAGHGAGALSRIGGLVSELAARLFHDNQYSGQVAFRFTYHRPVQNGRDWLSALLGVLPNNSGSSLPHEVFKTIYGTDRGTAPPSMWGSTYYNFGWTGVLLLAVLLGVAFQTLTFKSVRTSPVNTLELVGMAGVFTVCGSWVVDGPMYLLNTGAVTFAILWWIGRHAAKESPVGTDGVRAFGFSYQAEPVTAGRRQTSTAPRVLVITVDPYQYATRAKKAAAAYRGIAETTYLGTSGVGRTGRWAEPGETTEDGVRVIHVPVRRPWLRPTRRTQLRNLLVSYVPAIIRITIAAIRSPADVVQVCGAPLAIVGILHKLVHRSWFILDINERPGAVTTRGSLMSLFSWLERSVLRAVGRSVDLATVVTHGDLAVVRALGLTDVRLVRNAPLAAWRAEYITPPSDSTDIVTLVVIGTIFEGRGYEVLLDAFSAANHDGTMQLRIYGGGRPDYVAALEARTRSLGISDSVHWMGRIAGSEVSSAYLASDIGLVLYEAADPGNDGLSNKILECVSSGRPVLAGDLPENRRFVTENSVGWLTDVSAQGLTDSLLRLQHVGGIHDIAAHCRQLGDTWLNWEAEFVPVLESTAQRMAQRHGSPTAND